MSKPYTTTPKEWAKHLRPDGKRAFWKQERRSMAEDLKGVLSPSTPTPVEVEATPLGRVLKVSQMDWLVTTPEDVPDEEIQGRHLPRRPLNHKKSKPYFIKFEWLGAPIQWGVGSHFSVQRYTSSRGRNQAAKRITGLSGYVGGKPLYRVVEIGGPDTK